MEYYTEKDRLILPEYGRNIQQMVEYAMTIEDKDERTKCVRTIISVMGNLFPHLRNVNDFKHKLWDHLAIMSNFELDIDYPYEVPQADILQTKPDKLPYPATIIRYRHYGQTVIRLVDAAIAYKGEDRDKFIELVANHMKKCILNWNRDSVEDNEIFKDLKTISKGEIDLVGSGLKLREVKEVVNQNRGSSNHHNNQSNKGKQRSKNSKR